MNGIYKKDYEPYHALGPQIGVFDQRAAEMINDYIDAMGFDAIQTGGMLAWMMDIIASGMIDPAEYGFPPANEMKFAFYNDPAEFDLVADSARNAEYARALVDAVLFKPEAELFRAGIRFAALELDRGHGTHTVDRAVYIPHGENGYMVPNQYWVTGMLSPMPMMGKYYVYYEGKFMPPYELGRKNVERMTYELFTDNSGLCRFHRKWAETITDEIIKAHYSLDVDYKEHQFILAKHIHESETDKSVVWESERVGDLIRTFLEQWERFGLQDPALADWLARFRADQPAAARAWWLGVLRGIKDAFEAGASAIPDQLTPGQSAAK
jgi:glyceraldehyde-3-phosphate dehydrogenase (ferredoxin)